MDRQASVGRKDMRLPEKKKIKMTMKMMMMMMMMMVMMVMVMTMKNEETCKKEGTETRVGECI